MKKWAGIILRLRAAIGLMSGTIAAAVGAGVAVLIILSLSMWTGAEAQRVSAHTEKATTGQKNADVNATCMNCHRTTTNYVVSEWERSKHHENASVF